MHNVDYPKILGIGNALVDIMTLLSDESTLQEFGLPKGSMTLVDRELSEKMQEKTNGFEKKITTGGSVANAMNGVANLGVPCGFIGSVAEDDMGQFFKSKLEENRIKPFLKKMNTRTGRAVALITPDGERTFGTYLGAAVDMGADDVDPKVFEGFDYFLIEGYLVQNYALILEAARKAKAAGLKVALDLASYNIVEANLEVLNDLVDNYVDILFANEEEAKAFTDKEPEDALDAIASRCDIAVVKVGSKGAFIKQGTSKWHIPAKGSKVVDTTGAGDFFAAGMLAGVSKGYELEKAGQLGALLAGRIIGVVGAQLDAEAWGEIKAAEAQL